MLKKAVEAQKKSESPSIEQLVGKEWKVLDHGFVRLVDYMGSDAAVVQAARISYGKGTKKLSEDRSLIRYLMRHRHSTPFEMCEIKLHVKLPIFVARQWVRHRTANINEYSARYSVIDKEFYVPDKSYLSVSAKEARAQQRLKRAANAGQNDLFGAAKLNKELKTTARQSETNKQGRDVLLDELEALEHLKTISQVSNRAYVAYERLLNETSDGGILDNQRAGLARELARIVLPTNYYTQWYWKIDLHNLLNFISLRADSHAQHEIQEYARVIRQIVENWVPLTWEAFIDYRQDCVPLSRLESDLIKRLLKGETCNFADIGLTKREWDEFSRKFDISNSLIK